MNQFYKNFIMCGYVEYHCLLCVETFYKIDDVEKHIRWEKHRKMIKAQEYFPKLRKDFIYKVENQFYCEICNIVSPDVANITAHIKSEPHVTNKANPNVEKEKITYKRDSGFVIVSDIILTKEEWNTVVNRHCLICDEDIVAGVLVDSHVRSPKHVIKLIQAKVVKEGDDNFYRKINPSLVYCLICKNTVPTEGLSGHCEDDAHIENKKRSISRTTKDTGAPKTKQNENMKRLMDIQKVLYDIDVKAGKATCKLCDKVVKFHFTEMLSHQEEHARSRQSHRAKRAEDGDSSEDEEVVFSEVTDHGKKRAELKQYGKKHSIKLNEGGSKGYCYICHTHVSAHKQVFRQHARGWLHRGHLEYKGLKKETKRERLVYKTEPLKNYLDTIFHSVKPQVLWINSEFGLDTFSFLLISSVYDVKSPNRVTCFVCKEEYKLADNEEHLKTAHHKANFIEAEVVATLEGEFIREIAPNLYHCGFCNRTIAYYDNVLRHFRNWGHKDGRVSRGINSKPSRMFLNEAPPAILSINPDVMYLQLMDQMHFTSLPAV